MGGTSSERSVWSRTESGLLRSPLAARSSERRTSREGSPYPAVTLTSPQIGHRTPDCTSLQRCSAWSSRE